MDSQSRNPCVVFYTDFGLEGPYAGQMALAVEQRRPGTRAVTLMHDAWAYDVQASAYLLPAVTFQLKPGDVCVAVVDPGVGTDRRAICVCADGVWFVGPDNGLFAMIVRRAGDTTAWQINWRPQVLSTSFHGRDLFAPIGAALAGLQPGDRAKIRELAEAISLQASEIDRDEWPDDLSRIIYVDRYGNLMSGLRAEHFSTETKFVLSDTRISHARTFAEVPSGSPFWYENSQGLVEIAVNQGAASQSLQWRGKELRADT